MPEIVALSDILVIDGSWLLSRPSAVSVNVLVVESPISIDSGGLDQDCVSSSAEAGSQTSPGKSSGTGLTVMGMASSDNLNRFPSRAPRSDRPGNTSLAVSDREGISRMPRCCG